MPCLRHIATLGLSLLLLPGCKDRATEAPAPQAQRFSPAVPTNLATEVPFPERNPFTVEGVALGRMLFYDPILSASNRVSCASCHQDRKSVV